MIEKVKPYAKAVVGFIAPAAVILTAAVTGDSDGGAAITTAEWVTALCACVITAAGVYAVPNTPAAAEPEAEADDYAPERADV